jgi:hypothetical protein
MRCSEPAGEGVLDEMDIGNGMGVAQTALALM